jgi:fluoride exporter
MRTFFLIFFGAGLGGVARYGVSLVGARLVDSTFPWATLCVNIVGSLLMGILAGWLVLKAGNGLGPDLRFFLATGVLGGFTTFSAFSLDAMQLWERGDMWQAALYVAVSVIASIAALAVGLATIRALT